MKAQIPPFFWASATVWSASVVFPEDSGPKISTTRPRGSPPTPSAMSSPSEPDGMVSMSIERSFLPSRMIEPLPKLRSIWASAASRAFDLSMDDPSTRRSAACDMFAILMTGFPNASNDWERGVPLPIRSQERTRFVLTSQGGYCTSRTQVLPMSSAGLDFHPGRLWSLWDMLKVKGEAFYQALSWLRGISLIVDHMVDEQPNDRRIKAFADEGVD